MTTHIRNPSNANANCIRAPSANNDENIGAFLSKLEDSAKKINDKKLRFKKKLETILANNQKLIDEKPFGLNLSEDNFSINQVEKEQLYCELIYTIKHKIGCTIDGHSSYMNDLYRYAQLAFKMSPEEHDRLFALVSETKPPILVLNVEVMEAKNLEAKDANGFSDPYCMLGVVPGSRSDTAKQSDSQNTEDLISPSTPKHEEHTSNKTSFIKRFSSFRKSDKTNQKLSTTNLNQNANLVCLKEKEPTRNKVPARFIKTTDVKKCTLNPVWMEKFMFQIDDIYKDTLHLDIWDHDDEFSVIEAARKLNEIKSLKGLDRYFKQIAQSARANKADNVDDFLGSVNIRLDDLASTGIEKWYELEGRSEKSKVEGKIRLRLKLATREDRNALEEDNWNDFRQQEKLISIFINYELSKLVDKKNREWRGEFSREAETILHQHAIQGDITDFQIAMCRWIAFSKKHLEKEISYKLLWEKMEKLEKVWTLSSPSRDEAQSLRESFDLFIKHCFKLITNLRDVFPVNNGKLSLEKLEFILKFLNKLFNMNAYRYCFPFHNSLGHEMLIVLKSASISWFQKAKAKCFGKSEEGDNVKKLSEFSQTINLDLYIAHKYYKPIFENETKIDYFTFLFKIIEPRYMELVKTTLIEEFGDEVNQLPNMEIAQLNVKNATVKDNDEFSMIAPIQLSPNMSGSSSPNSNKRPSLTKDTLFAKNEPSTMSVFNYNSINEHLAISVFELYICVNTIDSFRKYLDESDQESFTIQNHHNLFYVAFKRWIELIKNKIDLKIERCFDNEQNDVLTELTKFSSSSVEVSNCFNQVLQLWKLINWPCSPSSEILFNEIIESLSKAIIRYANLVKESNQLIINPISNLGINPQNNFVPSTSPSLLSAGHLQENVNSLYISKPLDSYQKIIITTNNIERVRESLKLFLTEIDHHNLQKSPAVQDKMKIIESNRALFESCISNTSDYLIQIIEQTLEIIVITKIVCDIKPHMFYLFESPESASAQESISRIIKYLDSNLIAYKEYAYKVNFERLLKLIWIKLLDEIEANLKKDDSRTNLFFAKMVEVLDLLVNFFNADNQGLNRELLTNIEQFKNVRKYCKLQTIETTKLIQMYYQELAAKQNSLKASEYGSIFCRAFYHSKDSTLVVEIFKCKNLVPMDQNGLSDPYVEVELKPKYVFPNIEMKTTPIIKKTLNPIFNEIFEFKIPEKLCQQHGNVLHFTVMDHDLMWTNDFEGEAFLELATLPGLRNDMDSEAYNNLKYSELFLIHPKSYPSLIIDVLQYRVQFKDDKLAVEFLKRRRDKLA